MVRKVCRGGREVEEDVVVVLVIKTPTKFFACSSAVAAEEWAANLSIVFPWMILVTMMTWMDSLLILAVITECGNDNGNILIFNVLCYFQK